MVNQRTPSKPRTDTDETLGSAIFATSYAIYGACPELQCDCMLMLKTDPTNGTNDEQYLLPRNEPGAVTNLVANAALFLGVKMMKKLRLVAFCYNLFWPGVVSWEGDGAPFEKSNQDINYKIPLKDFKPAERKRKGSLAVLHSTEIKKTGEEDDAHDMSEIIEERIKQMSVLPRRKESFKKQRERLRLKFDFYLSRIAANYMA
ncbi:hypothetical protein Tco_0901153 [Tanacetum coccineum]